MMRSLLAFAVVAGVGAVVLARPGNVRQHTVKEPTKVSARIG